ncbi:hypothetical protein PHISP_06866 [Aspergillus sp. HF37]|nr:hypothetical protein PHISP_06866 [Aspergillus sp. HF37]
MQNGNLNGTPHQNEVVTPETQSNSPLPAALDPPSDSATRDPIPFEQKEGDATTDHSDAPPSKKRRLANSDSPRRSISRAPSPPWRKAGVEGPTSFVQDGRRKSSRTNAVPLDVQPPSEKRHTRAARKQFPGKNDTGKPAVSSPLALTPSRSGANGRASANGSPKDVTRGTIRRPPRISHSPAPKKTHSRTRSQSSSVTNSLRGPAGVIINGSHPNADLTNSFSSSSSPAATGSLDDSVKALGDSKAAEEPAPRIQRLRIKVNKPSLGIQHPSHVLAPRKYGSFREWLHSTDGTVDDDAVMSPADALEEARKRRTVFRAAEPGGLLSSELCSAYLPEQQEEPPQQYSHQDHLVSHALYFKKLLDQEHRKHRQMAKLFAQWCADAWRKRHKDPEDVLKDQQEGMRGKRKQLAKDLQKMFDLTRAEVDRMRLARWEEERKAEDQQALDRAIKQSTMLFEKRRMEILGETGSDFPESSEDEGDESDSSEEDEKDNESNVSSSSGTEGENDVDADEGLTAEELRLKYANLPQTSRDSDRMSVGSADTESSANTDPSLAGRTPDPDASQLATEDQGQAQLEDVDPVMLDGSEESTDMDDDMGDSDMDEDSDEAASDNGSDDEPGLLGFFSSKNVPLEDAKEVDDNDVAGKAFAEEDEIREYTGEMSLAANEPSEKEPLHEHIQHPADDAAVEYEHTQHPTDDAAVEHETTQHLAVDAASQYPVPAESEVYTAAEQIPPETDDQPDPRLSGEASSEPSQGTLVTKPSEPESISSYEPPAEKLPGGSPAPGTKTPVPHLVRGTLREYQHDGMDWLAGLYSSHINGILADEMGLGKTIQTIALLAHLAVEHHKWGPHLVVVPTSVVLNWEMEFKKWCPGFKIMTYYGSIEERKQKRKGWMDDTSWNVLITSYQLVLQDQQVLKRRNWHYVILDEAHNIKNFRSQKWQSLLTFRSRARLLLTGTPLQNNLTELWSLLFFLMPSDGDGTGIEGFADLRNFSEWFRRPVEQILEHGRETMDDEAKQVVTKLHTVLRPYILRRLKADVEKQMPGKYEHVVYCRLSKRQRFLYDGFMSLAKTKATLASGNYLSIINCLMQLRKVCNHPDLFETRPISTSFAMPDSVTTEFGATENLVRRRLLSEHPLKKLDFDFLNLAPVSREDISQRLADDTTRLMAFDPFSVLRERQYSRTDWQMEFDGSTIRTSLAALENESKKRRMAELERSLYFESKRHGRRPVYGTNLIEFLTADNRQHPLSIGPLRKRSLAEWLSNRSSVLASMMLSIEERSRAMDGYIQRFACVTPPAVAPGVTDAALTPVETRYLPPEKDAAFDPFHEAQMRLSIAFPDKRLLQYDCGKLQRLDKLLRDLKAGGHRALIFTQMTKMLDILEQFLNIHGHRYLRLDGTTRIEQRQVLTDRFNNDDRILAFILSSRSGGLGINLTGADTVIFYDLDWNPAMDKQCQDRCHRIGQTRDVHIYRFVSEYTIESNILRKANQKRMLDDVVIQEGEFNTDYVTKTDDREVAGGDEDTKEQQDEASAAMDRVLATRNAGGTRAFEQAEDREDMVAAKNAQKELEHADEGDFEDRSVSHGTPGRPGVSQTGTPGPELITSPQMHGPDDEVGVEPQPGHIDDYLLRFMEWNMRDEPLVLPADKSTKKSKKGKEHRLKRR